MTIDARFLIEALKHGDIATSQAGDPYEIQVPEFDMPMDENSTDGSPGKGTDNEMDVATQDVRGDVKIPHSQIVQAASCGQQQYILEHPFPGAMGGSWPLGDCSLHRGHGDDSIQVAPLIKQ